MEKIILNELKSKLKWKEEIIVNMSNKVITNKYKKVYKMNLIGTIK